MKECDILGVKTYCEPPTYFQLVKTPTPGSMLLPKADGLWMGDALRNTGLFTVTFT